MIDCRSYKQLSRLVTKPTKWHVRPAKTRPGHPPSLIESSLSEWRELRSLATHWAHSKDSDQTGWMPRLIWVFAGRTGHFVGFVTRRLNFVYRADYGSWWTYPFCIEDFDINNMIGIFTRHFLVSLKLNFGPDWHQHFISAQYLQNLTTFCRGIYVHKVKNGIVMCNFCHLLTTVVVLDWCHTISWEWWIWPKFGQQLYSSDKI